MTEKKQTGKVIIVLALICAIGAGLLTGVNALTAPLIEANNASLAFGPLFEVMPDAKDFNSIYSAADPAASALADVSLVAGVTYSSSAFKNAVSDAFTALISNGLVSEGVKGDEQILSELLPQVFSGIANPSGVLQAEEVQLDSGSLVTAMKAANGSGFAFIAKEGEATYLVLVNADGSAIAYDVNGEDVSAGCAGPISEAVAYAQANGASAPGGEMDKLVSLAGDGASAEPIQLDGVFSTVTGAYRITLGDDVLYGFAARPYGFSNMPLALYYVLDENGAIVVMNADAFILEKEYFSNYTLDPASYKDGFAGLTADTYTGEQAFISGATVTTDAVAAATEDIFNAFNILKTNGGIA